MIRVDDSVLLEFSNGTRLRISMSAGVPRAARRGRKPSPATQALVAALQKDAAGGKVRPRSDYLRIMRQAGHRNAVTANIILAREAKRTFGRPLGRQGTRAPRPAKSKRQRGSRGAAKAGRPPSTMTTLLRERLQADGPSGLRDAGHYIRWLVDAADVGIRQARPVVYRELRALRN